MRLPFNGKNRITSGYKLPDRPNHNGLDIVGDDDKTDYAVIDGTIGFAGSVPKTAGGSTWEWGNYVRIDAIDGNKYYYCHLDSILVSKGQPIKEGQPIGIMGNTGYSFGAHTHLEIRKGNTPINPATILGIPNQKGTYTMANNNIFNGIDVSKYQGNIDWNKVKESGVYFAFIRVGFCNSDGSITDQSGFDPYFRQNMENAIKAGINVGVYVYSYADTEQGAIACANNVLDYIKPYQCTMPIVFDYEDSKTYATFGKQRNVNICRAFLSTIQNAGYYAMLYTYTNFANTYLDMPQLASYDFWVADYRGYCGYNGAYSIWQYGSNGSVPGISGRVDMNYMYKDLPSIIRKAGLNNLTPQNLDDQSQKQLYLKTNMVGDRNPNEYFFTMDTNDIAGKLDIGEYKVISTKPNQSDGFNWAEILINGNDYYAVYCNGNGILNDNRAILIEKQQQQKPPEITDNPVTDTPTEDNDQTVTDSNNKTAIINHINDLIEIAKEMQKSLEDMKLLF